MTKVFITGITGFLGSNVGRHLINNGCEIIATFRQSSSKLLCSDFEDKVNWILHNDDWQAAVIKQKPDIIIHCAWIGVSYQERQLWEEQFKNINYLNQLLSVAHQCSVKRFIGFGSQAEYGTFEGCIDEYHSRKPVDAYGAVKVICSEMVKQYCNSHEIEWVWLRLFSFFGKGESQNWLIPSLIKQAVTQARMDLTPGEQVYSYLYVDDLGVAINKIINSNGNSDFYNIAGKTAVSLKTMAEKIRDKVNPEFKLNFGGLNYRENQSMCMLGDVSRFIKVFGEYEQTSFDNSLTETISYYTNIYKQSHHEGI